MPLARVNPLDQGTARPRALVTGASSGIGLAIRLQLDAAGWLTTSIGRERSRVADCPGEIFELDLADLDRLPAALDRLLRQVELPDALVLAAGRGMLGSIEESSYAQIRSLIDLDLTAQIFMARAFLPAMKRRGSGHLIFMGSEAALQGRRRGTVYCAAKFAIRGFAQALREECAKSGVRVTVIHPGVVRTPFFDDLEIEPGDGPDHALKPEDVAQAVLGVLHMPPTAVVDEISVSALRQQVKRRSRRPDSGL